MATLSENIKLEIVRALACFDTPATVREMVKQEFGVEVTKQQLGCYDPATKNGIRLSPKLKTFFEDTRKKFLDNVSDIPIANQAFRLRSLQRMYTRAEGSKNLGLAAQLLEQAAKETGHAFTNRREITGKDGKDLPAPTQTLVALPAEEIRAALKEAVQKF